MKRVFDVGVLSMADPVSILSLISAAGTIASSIACTIKALSDIRSQFADAKLRISLLIAELSTVKSALSQVHDWAHYLDDTHQYADVVKDLQISIDGCDLAMEALAEEVAKVTGNTSPQARMNTGFRTKTRFAWSEASIKQHQDRLHGQVAMLQVLLHAVQLPRPEQMHLLENSESQQIRQKVVDDTCSLRATMSAANSAASASIADSSVREKEVSNEERIWIWGNEVSRADPFELTPESFHLDPDASGSFNDTTDTVASNVRITSASPNDRTTPAVGERSVPYTMSVASDSVVAYGQRCRAALENNKRNSAPSPRLPQSRTYMESLSLRRKSLEADRKPFWLTLLGKGSSRTRLMRAENNASAEAAKSRGDVPFTYRARRRMESSTQPSIDFGSTEGLGAPPIVRAAQSGSILEIEVLLMEGVNINETHAPSGRSALAVASHCGNESVVRLILEHGGKLDTPDISMMTPLHLAASRGHYGVIQLLLQAGASIDQLGPNNVTALRIASDNSHSEVADLLLSTRAKVNARDSDHLTALHAAAKRGDEAMVNLLVGRGGQVEARDSSCMAALHYAAENGHECVVKALLNRKANIHALGESSNSALACASAAGQLHVVELLLSRKADIKHKGEGNMTALHWAAYNGHAEVVDCLLRKRAAIDECATDLLAPLHLAIRASQFAVVELLLRSNATIEASSRSKLRPLHYACMEASYDIVNLLIESRANIEAEDENGRRPLHHVLHRGNPEILSLLLEEGCSIESRDKTGDRALCIACSKGDFAAARLLLEHGAAVTLKYMAQGSSYEDSPLCIAAKGGHTAIVAELISQGASVLQRDEKDWQPLRHAAHHGHPEVIELLLQHGATVSGTSLGSWGFGLNEGPVVPRKDLVSTARRKSKALRLLSDAEEREQGQRVERRQRLEKFIENIPLAGATHTLPGELSSAWEGIALPASTRRSLQEDGQVSLSPSNLVPSHGNIRSDRDGLASNLPMPNSSTAGIASGPVPLPIPATQEHLVPPLSSGSSARRRKSYANLVKAVRRSYGGSVPPPYPPLPLETGFEASRSPYPATAEGSNQPPYADKICGQSIINASTARQNTLPVDKLTLRFQNTAFPSFPQESDCNNTPQLHTIHELMA